jgi:hypothetical protein
MADAISAVPFVALPVPAPAALAAAPLLIELAQQPPAALLLAATLSATVIGRGGNGALLLRTDYGALALQTALDLPPGSTMQLKMQPGPPATVLLLGVTPPPANPAAAQPPPGAAPGAAATTTATPAAPTSTSAAAATAAAAAAAETAAEPPPAQLALGTAVEATLLGPPPEQNLPALVQGTRLVMRLALQPPNAPPPESTGLTPVRFIAAVLPPAADGNGHTALATPLGTVLLDQRLALPPGTRLAVTMLSTTPPEAAPGELGIGTQLEGRMLTPAPGGAAASLPSGTQLSLRVAVLPAPPAGAPAGAADLAEPVPEIMLPGSAAAAGAPAAALGAQFIGTVVAGSASETLVETPLGMLGLEQRLALPPGTLLGLELLAAAAPEAAAPAPVAQSETWPALAEALSTLERTLPGLAAQLRAELSPASGDELAGTLLFLMSALNSGAWPGSKLMAALDDAGRGDLRQRLDGDVAELRQLADPASGDWRVFLLPLIEGGMIRPVRIYLRRRPPAAASSDQGTRFLLEVDTSRLGAVQLDGLVRPQRFDLVLRSHRAFDAVMRQEIAAVFRDSITASGLAGDITFTTAPRFAIAPLEALRTHVGVTA